MDVGDFITVMSFDMLAYQKKHHTKAEKKTQMMPSWLNAVVEEQKLNIAE